MKKLDIYLTYNGNCEEAFSFYQSVFGGEFDSFSRFKEMPPSEEYQVSGEESNLVMHVSLPLGNSSVLMGSDTSTSFGDEVVRGTNFSISISADSKEEADKLHVH